jgi:hypothetical protein
MLKLNPEKKTFETLIQSELKTENILERYDFQAAMVKSWETIKNEIGLPTSYLIGQEINPHKSVGNSIDLLAFNPDDSSLIVIELKRDKNKLQLLQALSYASMIAKWNKETLISEIQRPVNPEPNELIDLINNNELNSEVKIILISELYDPEVIITAEWLNNNYGLDIVAYSVSIHKMEEQIFVNFEQRLPLKELADVYEERGRKLKVSSTKPSETWEDVLPKLKYKFAKKALDLCRKEKDGDPSRRRFVGFRSNYDGFVWISINFREKYLNIYIKGKYENAEKFLKSNFSDKIEIFSWQDGYSFKIDNEKQFDDLVEWLKIGQN